MRRPFLLALAVVLALACSHAGTIAARPGDTAPAWLREAASRQAPAGTSRVVLHREVIVEPLVEGGVRTTTRVAERALAVDGLAALRDVHVLHGAEDTLVHVQAWNLLPDGTVLVPDPKHDVRDVPWRDGWTIDRVFSRHVEVPGVATGSVVGWESVVVDGIDRGAASFHFVDDVPTALARVTLRVPDGWTREVVVRRAAPVETRSDSTTTLELRDVAPPKPDPFPPADGELPLAWLRWFSPDGSRGHRDWASVARWHRALTREIEGQAGTVAAVSASLAPSAPSDRRAAVERAFAFASRDVRYVAVEIGIGGYEPASPDATCRDRFGDCKAKSFLLRSLLAPWGVRSWPVLVLTRDEGPVDPDVPTPGQFNHLVLAVEVGADLDATGWTTLDVPGVGRLAFLNPTASFGTSAPLRGDDQDTLALLVHDTAPQLVRIPVQSPESGGIRREVVVEIDDSGTVLDGLIVTTRQGHHARWHREQLALHQKADRMLWAREALNGALPGASVKELTHAGLDAFAEPLTESVTFTGGHAAKRVVNLLVLLPGTFADAVLSDWPSPPPREWTLDIGAPRRLESSVTIRPPGGWRVEKPAKPWTLETPWLTASVSWHENDGGTLEWKRVVRVLVASVGAADYAAFREALAAIRSRDEEGLTLVQAVP